MTLKRACILVIVVIGQNYLLISQTHDYGKLTGTYWLSLQSEARDWLSSLHSGDEQMKFAETLPKSLAKKYKMQFLLGFLELAATLPSNLYFPIEVSKPKKEKRFFPSGGLTPYIFDIYPSQIMDGLDTLYSDYRNLDIKIIDGMRIVHMEVNGKSPESVEWLRRYFRADNDTQISMREQGPPDKDWRPMPSY